MSVGVFSDEALSSIESEYEKLDVELLYYDDEHQTIR